MRSFGLALCCITVLLTACQAPGPRGRTVPVAGVTQQVPPETELGNMALGSQSDDVCPALFGARLKDTSLMTAYHIVARAKLKKDPFETTTAYSARLRGEIERVGAALREKTGSHMIAFSRKVYEGAIKYDADTQTMKFGSGIGLGIFGSEYIGPPSDRRPYHAYFPDEQSVIRQRDIYKGSNAFGVTRNIVREERYDYGVYFAQLVPREAATSAWPYTRYKAAVKMAPETARRLQKNLDIVFIGTIETPFHVEKEDVVSPTIHRPLDATIHKKGLVVKIVCSAIADRAAGAVVHRIK